jgi:DNA-binding NarL/FixJ family response regulator
MKIVVIEDQAIVQGLARRVGEEAFKSAAVTCTREGKAGVELCKSLQPELVLLDLELPDADGHDLIRQIRAVAPAARILVLSSHTEAYILHRVREAGVDGFFDKNEQSPDMLASALKTVASGGRYFSPTIEEAFNKSHRAPDAFQKLLSEREQELLRHFGDGLSDTAIAELTGLKEFTVRNHRRSVMIKLGIHSTPALIRYALENGFSRVKRVS